MTEQCTSLSLPEPPTDWATAAFQRVVYGYYRENGRSFPWRDTTDPYHILVSEVMLQQTQTSRVREKYPPFVTLFPDLSSLARAPLSALLQAWLGLGYNRRALALHRTAQIVETSFHGELPSSPHTLATLPGIGRTTASAIAAFAFGLPTVFIETNIRTVFLHLFFPDRCEVTDREILPLVERTLDRDNPREWYYALLDYGAMLKREGNPGKKSAHYRTQAPFPGSNREVRSLILKAVLQHPPVSEDELVRATGQGPARVRETLRQLQREGFLAIADDGITIR